MKLTKKIVLVLKVDQRQIERRYKKPMKMLA